MPSISSQVEAVARSSGDVQTGAPAHSQCWNEANTQEEMWKSGKPGSELAEQTKHDARRLISDTERLNT